jgi:hypothetical protein
LRTTNTNDAERLIGQQRDALVDGGLHGAVVRAEQRHHWLFVCDRVCKPTHGRTQDSILDPVMRWTVYWKGSHSLGFIDGLQGAISAKNVPGRLVDARSMGRLGLARVQSGRRRRVWIVD